MGSLTGRLLSDPRNLEVRPAGMGQYSLAWIAALRDNPDTAFIIPQTRSISAQLELFPAGETDDPANTNASSQSNLAKATKVDLIPSAPGDPLLGRWQELTGGGPAPTDSEGSGEPGAQRVSRAQTWGECTGRTNQGQGVAPG